MCYMKADNDFLAMDFVYEMKKLVHFSGKRGHALPSQTFMHPPTYGWVNRRSRTSRCSPILIPRVRLLGFRQFRGFFSLYKLPRVLKMGGHPLGGNFCAETDFEVRFAKFRHLVIAQSGSRRFRIKKGSGKSGSRECLKMKIKGVDKKHWPQFISKIQKRIWSSSYMFSLTYCIQIAPEFDTM